MNNRLHSFHHSLFLTGAILSPVSVFSPRSVKTLVYWWTLIQIVSAHPTKTDSISEAVYVRVRAHRSKANIFTAHKRSLRSLCMAGGYAWQGVACMAGGMRGMGACMAGGRACGGGIHGRRGCALQGPHPRRYHEIRSKSGRYASYWNAFLSLMFALLFSLWPKETDKHQWIFFAFTFAFPQVWMRLNWDGRGS